MESKYHFGYKLSAVGFIILTLSGNFAWIELVFHNELPPWIKASMWIGVGFVFLGSLIFSYHFLRKILALNNDHEN